MNRGWTKRWRKRWDKGLHQDLLMWVLMDYFIDFANHKKTEIYIKGYGMVKLERGQHLFGTNKLSEYFGVTRQKLRSSLERLQKVEFLTITATNRFSIATVINYNTYQPSEREDNHQRNQPATSQQPASNQPTTTPKELKELKEREISPSNIQQIINDAITYLNTKAGVNFNPDQYVTQTLMIDRINEGATLDDFKLVINKKCIQWLNDANMSGNLRPVTLFASDKFEGYLQEARRNNKSAARQPETRMLQGIELLGFGMDVLTKFGEDKFQEFCDQNKLPANDIEAIRLRVGQP